MIDIRLAREDDRDAIWRIFHSVVTPGDTYAFDPKILREDALEYWLRTDTRAYVVEQDRHLVGSYILKANQPALGAHVANAAFMVSASARGQGVGRTMGEHCLAEARRLGFRAMQFNFVVSTNESAIRLWEQLGFKIIGALPGAFRHSKKGYVDVYVMFRSLIAD